MPCRIRTVIKSGKDPKEGVESGSKLNEGREAQDPRDKKSETFKTRS